MGLTMDDSAGGRLLETLGDSDPLVRRVACESLVRGGYEPPSDKLLPLLIDSDRFVAYAARRALERTPPEQWQQRVLEARRIRLFLQGATALLAAHPSRDRAVAVVDRAVGMLQGDVQEPGLPKGFIRDEDVVDLLRVLQLALVRGELPASDLPQLGQQLLREYPSRSAVINRELVRLLVYLAPPSTAAQMLGQLAARIGPEEKLHIAMHAPLMEEGWSTQQKLGLIRFYEQARNLPGGKSLGRYVDHAARRLAEGMNESEKLQALAGGRQWPSAALAVLTTLPPQPGKSILRQIKQLDRELDGDASDEAEQLRVGIAAVLGRSRDPQAMAYLRQLYHENPSRRTTLVMGLAQDPAGENWPLLTASLGILDGVAASEVLTRLAEVDRIPDSPEPIRQAILCGLRNPLKVGPASVKLLTKWAERDVAHGAPDSKEALARWQSWFSDTYPDHAEPRLPEESEQNRWTMSELSSFLESPAAAQGDPKRGAEVFRRADCAKCHRYGDLGERLGPDLTTVSRRFHTREILESILFPSHVISDQYASQTVLTTDGQAYTGIVVETTPQHVVLLLSDARKMEIATERIEETSPSKLSAMPDGLLNSLSLGEIADLFAYLASAPRTIITSRRVRPGR
jgi:putative heme-binding domain-containing protein